MMKTNKQTKKTEISVEKKYYRKESNGKILIKNYNI